ncbi:MAG: PPC domain-containing protein [Minicystis sp.]
MRSTYLFGVGLLAGVAAMALSGVGCGGGGETGTGGGGGGTSSSTSSSTTSSSVSSSSSSGGVGGFDGASDIDPTGTQSVLEDPSMDVHYYKFDGNAGDLWLVSASSHPQGTDEDPGYIDTFIELYDANKKLIATNDNRYPRANTDSEIVTVLPSTGTYYIKLMEWCNSPTADATACTSDYFTSLTGLDYVIFATVLDPTMAGTAVEKEPNDSAATASPIAYAATTTAGSYYLTVVSGKLPMSSDADWYSVKIPADLSVDPGARNATSFLFPWGATTGNGSNIKVGKVELVEKSTMNVIGAFDMTGEPENPFDRAELRIPVTPGVDYFLKVSYGGAQKDGQGDFYVIYETLGEGNPVEVNEVTNSVIATPEVLPLATGTTGSYFVEGNILTPGAAGDVDYFQVATQGQETVSVACSSMRAGSGLGGFKATVLSGKTGNAPIASGSATETATADLFLDHVAIPAGETDLIIKLEAATQDATNKGTHYICGFHMAATPAP